jgi:2-dehydro-3-deoxy-D-arabinonate dehydratase
MILYRTSTGIVVEHDGQSHRLPHDDWDELINREATRDRLVDEIAALPASAVLTERPEHELLPPVGRQEVWAAGVTYYRSRSARMEESRDAGGGSFYDRVYEAERPELFPKATPHRVIGHRGEIRIRGDATWSVPEPELALVINSSAEIVGYTIGDDVSSRDIEGENPLYLPQAKSYDGACALGPGVLLSGDPLPPTTAIELAIVRGGTTAFQGDTSLDQMRRSPEELVAYLYRELTFPNGSVLMTGTGIVPDDSFTLHSGDEVRITIEPIGTLVNQVG